MTTTTDIDTSELSLTELAARADAAARPLEKLQALRDLETALKRTTPVVVAQARDEGATNADVGRHLGVSRQAVAKRFPRDPEALTTDSESGTLEEGGSSEPVDQGPGRKLATRTIYEVTTSRGRVIARINRLGRSPR